MRWFCFVICVLCSFSVIAKDSQPSQQPTDPQTAANIVISNDQKTTQEIQTLFDEKADFKSFEQHKPEKLFSIPAGGENGA